ncbi:hypothetical protein IFM89_036595 [Coptis chinensis]|uniref:X8 domain-containing protein n=1 Tax=Coptis chinensis TaxID=261450 RepID=A0A835HJ64_9MAGN|nr:hypothetical protein IFM89_036595 [Coptis chinensis]
MFDAQMDAIYSAMKRLGYGDVDVVAAETGWPSVGEPNQPDVNLENAVSYNGNLVKHVNSGKGTPLMPNRIFETFIFSLFNENLKPGFTDERNFGLFRSDLTPVYDVGVLRDGQVEAPSIAPTPPAPAPADSPPEAPSTTPPSAAPSDSGVNVWCVAKADASDDLLQSNIDYVCRLGIDCTPIQEGGPCFEPNTVRSHAAFAMNAYYQTYGRNDLNCNFADSGMIVTSDPKSYKGTDVVLL